MLPPRWARIIENRRQSRLSEQLLCKFRSFFHALVEGRQIRGGTGPSRLLGDQGMRADRELRP